MYMYMYIPLHDLRLISDKKSSVIITLYMYITKQKMQIGKLKIYTLPTFTLSS